MLTPTIRTKHQTHPSQGVCGNCVHDGDCVFQRNSPTTIIFCEEHEVERTIEPVHIPVRSGPVLPSVPGLCGTCDHLKTCALRSKDRIIHHCEHYR